MRTSFFRAIFALGFALPAFVQAQSVSITGGAPATQTFDSLSNDTMNANGTLPTGWFLFESDTNANTTYLGDNGGNASGNTYSYGATGSTERAFGMLQSGSLVPTIGARLQNNTGATLTQLQVEFEGEQWRLGATGRTDRIDFQYSLNATGLDNGTWVDVDTLDFTAPTQAGTVGALDGNANTASISNVITGLSLANGATMWVRWTDLNPGGADDGLAIDDVVFSPPGDSPPAISSSVPSAGATGVARNQTISLTFTEPVTATDAWYELACTASGTHAVALAGGPTTYTLDPTVDFDYDEDCTLTLDPTLIVDQDPPADMLVGDTRVSFHTEVEPVDVAPTVSSFTPANGAGNVAVSTSIVVKFSEAVTVGANWYTLSCETSGAHAATVTADSPSQYTVDPDVDFGYVESCTFTVNGAQVTDLDGTLDPVAGTPATTFTTSAAPGDYYAGVDASSCVALRTTLHALIDDHTVRPYTGDPIDVWDMIEAGDEDPSVAGRVLDIYFNKSFDAPEDRDTGTSVPQGTRYNREHTWPQSRGFPNTNGDLGFPNAPRSDAHHLFASEKDWNADRGNRPFANCPPPGCSARHTLTHPITGGAGSEAACDHALGNCNYVAGADDNTGSFEVWSRRKGDVARGVLYMDVRYEGGVAGAGSNTPGQAEPDLVLTDNRALMTLTSGGTAYMGLKSTLIAWAAADPPDTYEQLRNDVVFSFQGNRNPFIDNPGWVAIAFADPCTGTPPSNQAPTLNDVTTAVLENAANGATVATLAGTDPNAGQTLTYSIVSGNSSNAFAINPSSGAVTVANTALIDPAVATSYALGVRATDNGTPAMSDDATLTINVTPVNDAPSFTKGGDQTVDEDAGARTVPGWATAISAGPSDESSQTLTFAITGNTNAPLFSAGPAVAANGTLTYTPAANASGNATITLRVQDSGGTANGGVDASATQTFAITVDAVDDPAIATDDAPAALLEDASTTTFGVLANDTDPDGGAAFVVTGVTQPASGGTAAVGPAGASVTFTPASNFCGTTSFDYTITGNDIGTVDVTITCVNDAPSFTAGANRNHPENAGPQTVADWATGIAAGPANESGQAVTFEIVSNDNPSLFSAAPSVAANGTLMYTSATNAFGVATLQVRALDDGGSANGGVAVSPAQTFTITITDVVNQAAVANDDATTVVEDAAATTIAVLGNDSDAESDPFVVIAVTQPANGTAAIGPAGANVTFTPAANFCGAASFDYTVTGNDAATVSVTVTCVNDAPVASDASGSIPANSAAGTPVATVAATDVDGPALSYAITAGDAGNAFAIASNGAITVATPAAVTAGTFTLTVTVGDGTLTDTATVTITVTPPPSDLMFANGFE